MQGGNSISGGGDTLVEERRGEERAGGELSPPRIPTPQGWRRTGWHSEYKSYFYDRRACD